MKGTNQTTGILLFLTYSTIFFIFYFLPQKMNTLKNGFLKVKMTIKGKNEFKLIGKDFYHCCGLITTQNMKNNKNFRSQLSKISAQ